MSDREISMAKNGDPHDNFYQLKLAWARAVKRAAERRERSGKKPTTGQQDWIDWLARQEGQR